MNTTQTKFNLSEAVTSKKTGLPTVGKVIQISDPEFFKIRIKNGEEFKRWDELYENWLDKPVYTVLFNTPQRVISFQEYCEAFEEFQEVNRDKDRGYDREFSKEDLLMMYENNVKIRLMASYPEDDLEHYE